MPAYTAANYGQTINYGKFGEGAEGARDEAFNQAEHNDGAQNATGSAKNYADAAAKTGQGVQTGQQDAGAANNVSGGAGGNQAGAIELARRAATGQGGPSQGAYQLQAGLNQGTAQQSAMAAGARGSGAIAGAQANARANTSNLQQNAFTGAGMLKSQDMAAGRGLSSSLLQDKRGQDAAQIAEANKMGMANAGMRDDYQNQFANVALGYGNNAVAMDAEDLANYTRGMAPVYAQDDMKQDANTWIDQANIERVNGNRGK